MEGSLNLLGVVLPVVLTLGLVLVAVGALVTGIRARAGAPPEARGVAGWQLTLFATVIAFMFIQVVGYAFAFVL